MPKAHARSPSSCTAADDDRHATHLIPSLKQRVLVLDQIIKGPDLPSMGVTAKHQTYTGVRYSFGLPRFMGEENGCTRRSARERLRDGIFSLTGTRAFSKIIHAGQNKAGSDFGPRIA